MSCLTPLRSSAVNFESSLTGSFRVFMVEVAWLSTLVSPPPVQMVACTSPAVSSFGEQLSSFRVLVQTGGASALATLKTELGSARCYLPR